MATREMICSLFCRSRSYPLGGGFGDQSGDPECHRGVVRARRDQRKRGKWKPKRNGESTRTFFFLQIELEAILSLNQDLLPQQSDGVIPNKLSKVSRSRASPKPLSRRVSECDGMALGGTKFPPHTKGRSCQRKGGHLYHPPKTSNYS